MLEVEQKILVPDGDRLTPHPAGVCSVALKLRDEILRKEDNENGKIYFGRVSRKTGVIPGCLIELIPAKYKKAS